MAAGLVPAVPLLAGCAEQEAPVREPDGAGEGRSAYGTDPSQFGDLYLPSGDPRGVVVVIHGGFWRAEYDSTLGEPLATSLAAAGWAAWNLEYRRVGNGGGAPRTMDDIAAGIDRLADLPIDTSTVVALGHSAGGHLAAWAASRGRSERWQPERVPVTHVVSQAGVLDLRAAVEEGLGGGAVEALLGRPMRPADAVFDPMQQLPLDQPTWCVHGSSDPIVPLSQSQTYVDAARAAGASAELVEVAGDHFAVIDPTSDAWIRTLEVLDTIG